MAIGMLVDTTKCVACRGCQVACKQWNELPAEKTEFSGSYQTMPDTTSSTYTLVKFAETSKKGTLQWFFRKHNCMQCTEAACIKVCPVKAITKDPEGFKVRDLNKCIGCGLCAHMCPFSVPKLDKKEKKAKDCLFCADRIRKNTPPACAKTCPTGAVKFGERGELLEIGRKRVAEITGRFPGAHLYGVNELGGLGVMTILTEKPAEYGLPENPRVPKDAGWLRDVFDSVDTAGVDVVSTLDWIAGYIEKKTPGGLT